MIEEDEETKGSKDLEADEVLLLITRKFKRFMRRKRQGWRKLMAKGEPSKEKIRNPDLLWM